MYINTAWGHNGSLQDSLEHSSVFVGYEWISVSTVQVLEAYSPDLTVGPKAKWKLLILPFETSVQEHL